MIAVRQVQYHEMFPGSVVFYIQALVNSARLVMSFQAFLLLSLVYLRWPQGVVSYPTSLKLAVIACEFHLFDILIWLLLFKIQ